MASSDRQRHYQAGIALFEQRRFADAAVQFEFVLRREGEQQALRPHMRALSFLALSRALSRRPRPEDVSACERAAQVDDFDPVLHTNLGQICLMTGKTSRGLAALSRATRLDPANVRAAALLGRHDRRQVPVIARLDRDHPLNRSLGRLRLLLGRRRRAPEAGRRAGST